MDYKIGGTKRRVVRREPEVIACPSSTAAISTAATLAAEVSTPAAVPDRAPAPGTLSMGADERF